MKEKKMQTASACRSRFKFTANKPSLLMMALLIIVAVLLLFVLVPGKARRRTPALLSLFLSR